MESMGAPPPGGAMSGIVRQEHMRLMDAASTSVLLPKGKGMGNVKLLG